MPESVAIPVPVDDTKQIPSSIAEDKEIAAERLFMKLFPYKDAHTKKTLSKVNGFTAKKDPHTRTECHHR
jgi:hypothetical protein